MSSLNADLRLDSRALELGEMLSVEYMIDPHGEHDLEDILTLGDGAWTPLNGKLASFGYSHSTYWFRWQLSTTPEPISGDYLIEIAYPMLDQIDLFQVRPPVSRALIHEHWQLGDKLPFAMRPYQHRNFVIPVTLSADRQDHFLARIQSSSAVQVPIRIWTSEAFLEHTQVSMISHGMYFGLLAGMMVLHLALATMLRDQTYTYYALWLGALIVLLGTMQGFGMQFVWPEHPHWNDLVIVISLALTAAGGVMFTLHFIREGSHLYRRDVAFTVMLMLAFAILSAFALDYQPALFAGMSLVALSALISIAYAIRSALLGSPQGTLYLLAFAALITSTVVVLLSKLGVIPASGLGESALQLASSLQVVLLSSALGIRFAQERGLRRYAQQALIQTRKNSLHRIEAEVADRTKKLERINRELTRLSVTDALTGLPNRRYLDELFALELERAKQTNQPLSIGLIDIDHFKRFNDSYGHAAGDLCLRVVAQEIRRQTPRNGDMVARYGGEEFCVLMPNTHEDGARIVAERIRLGVSKLRINLGHTSLQTHVSIGIHTAHPSQLGEMNVLFDKADQALYRAKESGRNKVVASHEPARDDRTPKYTTAKLPCTDCEAS